MTTQMLPIAGLVLGVLMSLMTLHAEAPATFFTAGPVTVSRGEFIILHFGHHMGASETEVQAEVLDAVNGKLLYSDRASSREFQSGSPMTLDAGLFFGTQETQTDHQTIMIRLRSYDHYALSEVQTSMIVLDSRGPIADIVGSGWHRTGQIAPGGPVMSAPFLLTENHDATIRLFNAGQAPSMVEIGLVDTSSGQVVQHRAVNLQSFRGHAFSIPKKLMNRRFNAISTFERLPLIGTFQLVVTADSGHAQGDVLVAIEADPAGATPPATHKMTMQAISNWP